MKRSISVLVVSLSVVWQMGLSACDRQVPPPKAVKRLLHVPDTGGGMARGLIDKAKRVETTFRGRAPGKSIPIRSDAIRSEIPDKFLWRDRGILFLNGAGRGTVNKVGTLS